MVCTPTQPKMHIHTTTAILTKAIKHYIDILAELQYHSIAANIRDHGFFLTSGRCTIRSTPNVAPVFLGVYSKHAVYDLVDPGRFNGTHYKDALTFRASPDNPIRYVGATMGVFEHDTMFIILREATLSHIKT